MKKAVPFILSALVSCGQINHENTDSDNRESIKDGHWLFSLDIGSEVIPFNAFYSSKNEPEIFVIKNAEEVISVDDISVVSDSFFINLPVFGTKLKGKIMSDTVLSGYWINPSKKDYKIPFKGVYGVEERFEESEQKEVMDFSGKWDVTFSPDDENTSKSIGIFKQNGDLITGTFLTETGDFRYLEGRVNGNKMSLSCFDGAHAFLFKAEMNPEQEITGRFWSGNHWTENWVAVKNENIELTNPDSITHVINDDIAFDFSFPDLDENMVSINDPKFKNKVVIIQIMGTWCPNCADETRDLSVMYKRYHDKGLEIIAVAYERSADFSKNAPKIKKYKEELGADYTFLFAGKADRKANSEDFKMIDGISSYPTAIFIDRKGKIRKVHSGYYGPGTGSYYVKYIEETEMFIEKLLSEEISS